MAKISWGSSVFLVMILFMIPKLKSSDPNFLHYYCSNTTTFATADTSYPKNLNSVLSSLSSAAATTSTAGFGTASAGNGTKDAVFGLFLCRGDRTPSSCSDCVATAVRDQPKTTTCPRSKVGIIWYADCMIRYDDENFFGRMDQTPRCGLFNTQNITGDQRQFTELVGRAMTVLAVAIAKEGAGKKYGTMVLSFTSLQTVQVLEQCTPDLSDSDCHQCLTAAIGQIIVMQGARILQPSCNVRYEMMETDDFFNDTTNISSPPPSSPPPATTNSSTGVGSAPANGNPIGQKSQVPIAVVVVVPTSITILISVSLGILICMRKRKARESDYPDIKEISTMESLQFNIDTVRLATHNFSIDNKLGEGGFGEVYKGKLRSGQEVAVKRLLQNSKQGVTEFRTEVVLVAKLQHKNLVKLLGFCVTSKEKILIYEFLPNSSLDRYLFDRTSNASLDWRTKLNIIVGIARGVMYLHEDSRLKIIHRDLKTSNILLDDAMNPKISDFGLAKLFGEDQTQGDTKRIVGTYGYMAPEYAITGCYSVKSDVFSFGVIVLEIISGQKNRFFGGLLLEEALLHRAWRLWNERKPLDLVDTRLSEDFPHEEVIRCYHIGLLCIQEDATQRPGVRLILDALSRPSISLPEPNPPRFFGDLINVDQGRHSLPHSYTGPETVSSLYPRD